MSDVLLLRGSYEETAAMEFSLYRTADDVTSKAYAITDISQYSTVTL